MKIKTNNVKIVSAVILITIAVTGVWGRNVRGQGSEPLSEGKQKDMPNEIAATKNAVAIREVFSSIDLQTADKKAFSPFEPIEVKLVMTNKSEKSAIFIETSIIEDFDIIVKDSRGDVMPRTRFGKKSAVPTDTATRITILRPGKSRQFSMVINRIVDMTLGGEYFVTLRRPIALDKQPGYSESNVLSVKVVSPDLDEGAKTLSGGEAVEGP